MSNNKILIPKDGYNPFIETDPDKFVFHSDYDTLKYHASGTVSVTTSGSSAQETLAHGLGYIPFFVAYIKGIAGANDYNLCPGYTANMSGYIHADAYADDTNIYFKVHTDYFSGTMEFRYKIFRNRIDL